MNFVPQDDEFEQLLWIPPTDLYKYNTFFRAAAYELALKICGLV